jgi:hypothetical protein
VYVCVLCVCMCVHAYMCVVTEERDERRTERLERDEVCIRVYERVEGERGRDIET